MPELQIGALDPEALVQLNNAADGGALRRRGKLSLPVYDGGVLTVDLTERYRSCDTLIEEYWRFHPRYSFIKALVPNARLADVGTGSGGIVGWKTWGAPSRSDILMYAIDRVKGEHFGQFVDYDIVDLEHEESKYPDDAFDAVMCSRVIEYVENRDALAQEIVRMCRVGGRIYVEWPNSETDSLLTRFAFSPFGIPCGTLAATDDPDQVASLDRQMVRLLFEAAGAKTLVDGEILNDFLSRELIRCGVVERSEEAMTYGLNLALRLSRFLIVEKT